jgi:Ni,Fe-hydrogenase I cytochrome b subunit
METDSWRALRWGREKLPAMLDMLKYYFSLGRAPKPAYYAHSPLWLPFYALIFLLLTLLTATGYFFDAPVLMAGLGPWILHGNLAALMEILLTLHIASVVIHDLSAPGGDISGIISGYRLFRIEKPTPEQPDPYRQVQHVRFDEKTGQDR